MEATRPGYLWDRYTVERVRSLQTQTRLFVSKEAEYFYRKDLALFLAKKEQDTKADLIDNIHAHGVEAHPGDIVRVVENTIDAEIDQISYRIRARWRPTTINVLLDGPGADDRLWAVRGAPNTAFVTEALAERAWRTYGGDREVPWITVDKTIWEFSGWHEQRRCWIYTPNGK